MLDDEDLLPITILEKTTEEPSNKTSNKRLQEEPQEKTSIVATKVKAPPQAAKGKNTTIVTAALPPCQEG